MLSEKRQKIFVLSKNSVKNAKFGAQSNLFPISEKFKGKIVLLSSHNLLCRKFAAVCQTSVGNLQYLRQNFNFPPFLLF